MTSVLIIDDHPIVLQGLRRVLEDAGVKPVLEAREVTSGYRLFRCNRPDVIIVDLGMQGRFARVSPISAKISRCESRSWAPTSG